MKHTGVFFNMAVADLPASIKFFTAVGYRFNQQFTDESATCMIVGDNLNVMLMTHERFKGFTKRGVADPRKANEVIFCLSCQSRTEVDEIIAKAVAAGGKALEEPQDHGWMYGQSYEDLDGHIWEIMWMDANGMPKK